MRWLCAAFITLVLVVPAGADIVVTFNFTSTGGNATINGAIASGYASQWISPGTMVWSSTSFNANGAETDEYLYGSGGQFSILLISNVGDELLYATGTVPGARGSQYCMYGCSAGPFDRSSTFVGGLTVSSVLVDDSLDLGGGPFTGSGTFSLEYGSKALDFGTVTLDLVPVPEPATILLLLGGLGTCRYRRRK
jgi:hypothetical protein